jgi:hypothetical protein
MENPQTWGEAEHLVCDALEDHEKAMAEDICGLSVVRRITDALRKEGLLNERNDTEEGSSDV